MGSLAPWDYSLDMATEAPVKDTASTAGRARSAPDGEGSIDYERRRTIGAPKGGLLSGVMAAYRADPVEAPRHWRDEHGDFVPIRFGPFRAHLAFGPTEIEELLVDRAADFRKSFGTRMLIPLLGRGLLTAEGDEWLRHRRLISPAFHRERIEGYGLTMVRYAQDAVDAWARRADGGPSRRDDGADAPDRRPDPLRRRRERAHRGGRPAR